MFLQQVAESLIGQLLEIHHAIAGKQIYCMPRLIIK